MIGKRTALAALTALTASAARADVVISTDPTSNMSCSGGVCAPTATDAVLNGTDLENMLTSGSLTVATAGSGVQASNIDLEAALGWSSTNALSLDAYQTVAINAPVSIADQSGLSLTTNDGGTGGIFSIGRKGDITFQNLSSHLTINDNPFTLVSSISSLASAIASNPAGNFALSNSYDASVDGTYDASPIQSIFRGMVEGLGNRISNLSIKNRNVPTTLALFYINYGTIQHLGVTHVDVVGSEKGADSVAALVVNNGGYLFQDFATGRVKALGAGSSAGGLAADTGAVKISMDECYADVRVEIGKGLTQKGYLTAAGGLAGSNDQGIIQRSFSTGSVFAGDHTAAGGLIGVNLASDSPIENSYSTGAVTGGLDSKIGGFVGEQYRYPSLDEGVETSYSTGAVSAGASSEVGGFVGQSWKQTSYVFDYWDTTTSGTSQATGKGRSNRISGLTTEEFQSGLPHGFDPSIWAETPNINNGFPYLINNPPPN